MAVNPGSNSLPEKTQSNNVSTTPVIGELLFYVKLPTPVVLDPETRLDISETDMFGKETVFTQRMSDWLAR